MDNQHKKISGYRDFDQNVVDTINTVKAAEKSVLELLAKIEEGADPDLRWSSIAKTDLQKGFMALVRSVAKPEE